MRDWESNLQVLEAPWPLYIAQKDNHRDTNNQNNPVDDATNREDEADAQGTEVHGKRRSNIKTPQDRQGLVRRLRLAGGYQTGGRRRKADGGREGPMEGRTPRV